MDWLVEQQRQEEVGKQADELVIRLGLSVPIDPFKVIESEYPFLKAGGRDFRNRFDGKLKFNKASNTFLLFFNTKYDVGLADGEHHPRTRFSIAHELGHYFIAHHYKYLRHGGKPHPSSGEFRTNVEMEREADAFAASLLLPTHLVEPEGDKAELSFTRIDEIARQYNTSLVSTAIRAVRLSRDPCAVAGLRGGRIEWMFRSERLIEGGCYPGKRKIESSFAQQQWKAFEGGGGDRAEQDGKARHWFEMYSRSDELHDLWVTEHFLPVQSMDTLIVLLTMDDGDLFRSDDDDEEDDG